MSIVIQSEPDMIVVLGFRHLDLSHGQDDTVLVELFCWRANARGT